MKALSSMATRALLADLASAAAEAGLPRAEIESVGGVDAARRVAAGERLDLVLLASESLQELADHGHVVPSSVTPIVLSRTALAIRAEEGRATVVPAGPAFDDAAGVRAALRAAGRIGYSTGPSGTAMMQRIEDWGMTEELQGRLMQARPGMPVARLVAEGEVDLGLQQLSEMVGQEGIRILGVLPPDCAIDTVFAGAVATTSTDPAASHAVLSFFASDATRGIKRTHVFQEAHF